MEGQGSRQTTNLLHTERGNTTISDSVVAKIASIAAQEVEGIRMGGASQAIGGILGSVTGGSQTQGVSVEVGQEEAALDLTLTAEYGKSIPQLTEVVRRNVINRVENLVGLRVTEININVFDTFFPQQEAEQQRELEQQRWEQAWWRAERKQERLSEQEEQTPISRRLYGRRVHGRRVHGRWVDEYMRPPGDPIVDRPEPPGDVEDRRYFNVLFTEEDGHTTVPAENPLVSSRPYVLLADVSPERKGLGEDDTYFPDEILDDLFAEQGVLPLTVIASSRDFSIKEPVRTLYLPSEGASEKVRFEVLPTLAEGRGFMQVELLYKGHLLQSKRVEALIVLAEDEGPSVGLAQTARVTFTTTNRLDPRTVLGMPERWLTVNAERDERDGGVELRFLDRTDADKELARLDTRLQPEELGGAVEDVRRTLEQMVRGRKVDGQVINGYEWIIDGDDALLDAWLPRLAQVGRKFYRRLLPQNQRRRLGEDNGERLRAALQPGAIIQINPVHGRVTIPWGLLYERKLRYVEGRTLIEGRTVVCPEFTTRDYNCTGCKFASDGYTVCPNAFWGYRYAIEQLPTWVSDTTTGLPELVRQIGNSLPLQLNFNVYRKFAYWEDHLSKIKSSGGVETLKAEVISELEEVWEAHGHNLDVVYFYSHGGTDPDLGDQYLEISDGRITSNYLEDSELNWPHKPLVFLNGCATGDYGPDDYLSLIGDFLAAGASGVVGTECAVPEMFAEAYAAELFPRFFRGESLGKAMLDVRRALLQKKKNPLGLLYALYAANEVSLAHPVPNGMVGS